MLTYHIPLCCGCGGDSGGGSQVAITAMVVTCGGNDVGDSKGDGEGQAAGRIVMVMVVVDGGCGGDGGAGPQYKLFSRQKS